MIDILIANPYMVLLVVGFFVLLTSIMLIITRNNYSRIVKMVDKGEEEAKINRIEDWGYKILNDVQQECMERKIKLTMIVFLFPVLSSIIILLSFYKLNMITNFIIAIIHLLVLFIIYLLVRSISRKKRDKKNTVQSKDQNEVIIKDSNNNNDTKNGDSKNNLN